MRDSFPILSWEDLSVSSKKISKAGSADNRLEEEKVTRYHFNREVSPQSA